jgi:hypothetical protein
MLNVRGNVVSVNATTVLSAVASQVNSTNSLYSLCTRALPPLAAVPPFLSKNNKPRAHHTTRVPSHGQRQLADSGHPAVSAALVIDRGLSEGKLAG